MLTKREGPWPSRSGKGRCSGDDSQAAEAVWGVRWPTLALPTHEPFWSFPTLGGSASCSAARTAA